MHRWTHHINNDYCVVYLFSHLSLRVFAFTAALIFTSLPFCSSLNARNRRMRWQVSVVICSSKVSEYTLATTRQIYHSFAGTNDSCLARYCSTYVPNHTACRHVDTTAAAARLLEAKSKHVQHPHHLPHPLRLLQQAPNLRRTLHPRSQGSGPLSRLLAQDRHGRHVGGLGVSPVLGPQLEEWQFLQRL